MQYCKLETGQWPAKIYIPSGFLNYLSLKKCCYRPRSFICTPTKYEACDAKYNALVNSGYFRPDTQHMRDAKRDIEKRTEELRNEAAKKAKLKFRSKPCGLFSKGRCNYQVPGYSCPFVHGNTAEAAAIPCCSQQNFVCFYKSATECPYAGHVDAVCPRSAAGTSAEVSPAPAVAPGDDIPDDELMAPDDLT